MFLLLRSEGTVRSAWAQPSEALKTAVPALLYLGQNNLQYVAVGLLDAATYTVAYQTKTIWSGIFSVFLIGRALTANKWVGLAMLSLGVGVVQLSGVSKAKAADAQEGGANEVSRRATGFFVILSAAALSSMAGVYFEKILKGSRASLWTRNLQLAFYSVLTAFVPLYMSGQLEQVRNMQSASLSWRMRLRRVPFLFCMLSYCILSKPVILPFHFAFTRISQVQERGFFYGYTPMTWTCIAMNAGGGLLVGTVIKYADAVTKDVAIGASIVLSSLTSVHLFGFEIDSAFMAGVALVIYSVFLYGGRATCFGLFSA